MSRPKPSKAGAGKARAPVPDRPGWLTLTWDDLHEWAGTSTVERGRDYQRGGRVKDLAISADGILLATVVGTERYATTVSLDPDAKRPTLQSACSCPVGFRCKHAVAVIAEYLKTLADGRSVPIADEDDRRWAVVDGVEDDDWDGDDEDDEDEIPRAPTPKRKAPARPRKSAEVDWDAKIEQQIRAKSRAELADLAWSLVRRFPEVRQEFRERIALQEGDVDRLVADARREIRQVTAEQAHVDWHGDGYLPDYSKIRRRFERMLELGHADAVVELARDYLRDGQEQVNHAHDEEGKVGQAFAETLPVIFRALMRSSLSGPERILFAIDAVMADDQEIVSEAAEVVFEGATDPEDWSAVADALLARLPKLTSGKARDDFSTNYRRDGLTGWIADALEEAERVDELRSLYESEARATGSYVRLVRFLLERGQTDDAERWAREGIAATVENSPGWSGELAKLLANVAEDRERWDVVAAHAAHEFFGGHPGAIGFEELMQAARKARVEGPVREAALRFLETGIAPYRAIVSGPRKKAPPARPRGKVKGKALPTPPPEPTEVRLQVDPSWPLPVPDYLLPILAASAPRSIAIRPHLDVLLSMAIAAKDSEAVLRWFDRMNADHPYGRAMYQADAVAEAVAATHPGRTLAIYTDALNRKLPEASPSAYEASVRYLRKLRPAYESLGRAAEWDALVASIREKYRGRPRFIEQLDRLDPRPIVPELKPTRK